MKKVEKFNFVEFIKNSNKAFRAAKKAQKRVMIAEDVILRIKNKNINPIVGQILIFNDKDLDTYSNASFKNTLNNNNLTSCKVCAKGALFCSIIGRTNKITINEADDYESTYSLSGKKGETLKKYFSEDQIDMIETAYEGVSYMDIVKDKEVINKCQAFYKLNKSNHTTRMIAICENIIQNQGTFKP